MPGLDKDFDLLRDQLRAIENKRLVQGPLLKLSPEQMRLVDEAIREVLDLIGKD